MISKAVCVLAFYFQSFRFLVVSLPAVVVVFLSIRRCLTFASNILAHATSHLIADRPIDPLVSHPQSDHWLTAC